MRRFVFKSFNFRQFSGLSYIEKLKRSQQKRKLKPDEYIQRGDALPDGLFIASPQDKILGTRRYKPVPVRIEAKQILNNNPEGYILDPREMVRIRSLLLRHPFYSIWVGDEAPIESIRTGTRYSFGRRGKCFIVKVEGGDEYDFGIRYAANGRKENLVNIYIEACKSAIETSQLKRLVKTRLEEKQLTLDFESVCLDFASALDIQVKNAEHIHKVVTRNILGYWHLSRNDVKEEFRDFYIKSIYKSKYLKVKGEEPQEVLVRPSIASDKSIRDILGE